VDLLLAATASGPPSALRPFIDSTVVIEKEDVSFTGVGASYDSGTFVLSAEYTKRRSDSFIADTTGWYVNAGYRMGAFTPYVGLSRLKVDDANKSNPLSAALGAVSGTGAVARGIQGLLNVQKLTQRTVTAGVRWDFMSSAALKVQFDQIRKPADSYGLFYTVDPGTADARSFLNEKRKVNVVSVAIDVVF
jgi:predicted porin